MEEKSSRLDIDGATESTKIMAESLRATRQTRAYMTPSLRNDNEVSMASDGLTMRHSSTSSTLRAAQNGDTAPMTHKIHPISWGSLFPYSIPPDPETAAVRTLHNLARLRLYYTLLLWVVLFITLVPVRHAALLCLVTTSHAGVTYGLLLKAYPGVAEALDRIVGRRVVVGLLVVAVVVEMVVTEAVKHLLLSVAGVAPVVLVHAVFWVGGVGWPKEVMVLEGEMEKLVEETEARDLESGH